MGPEANAKRGIKTMWQDRRERRRERRLAKAERLGRQQEIQASPEVYQQATRSAHLKSGGLVP